ncbi:MBL fold metallo-hydrolase [Ferruginibacter albus]|uniref:MBL fold metallo-hydrolase n=1 Tax=Ferruginibacter albus TaxID=2875540 RepID=UPI001CC5555A|nr:MBL fold metallo-hydrolase [Ferruginibacter albus]
MQQPVFGKKLMGQRLKEIKKLPNYKKSFQNISYTPSISEDTNIWKVLYEFMFKSSKRAKPLQKLPSIKTDLLNLNKDENVLVWFGHSSYFLQIDGKRFLVDPVLSGSASPVSFTNKSFVGSDIYTTNDIPEIDYLFISHDHYDHLDYITIKKLQPKIKKIITGIGVAEHLLLWGYKREQIIEKNWNDKETLEPGFSIAVVSARHFSGRSFKRNSSLWISLVLQTPTMKLFLGGDSGYDKHFKEAGEQYGPFDLAILECGQYNKGWKYIHMMPEETVQAAIDLKAKKLLPVHWAKFKLANHSWDEPIIRVTKEAKEKSLLIATPMIGEAVHLNTQQQFSDWWTTMQ